MARRLRPGFAGQTKGPRLSCSKRENISRTPTAGLPYYIGGTIAEREKLFVQTPTSFGGTVQYRRAVENEVIGIDTAAKSVEVRGADGSTYTERYDKLLLSPGASPCVRR